MIFWIVAAALALVTVGLFALALTRRAEDEDHPAAYDLQVYRDQLKEVDKDQARGVIGAEDATRMKTEISRRILAADAQMQKAENGETGGRRHAAVAAAVLGLAVLGGSFGLYYKLGAPGYRDMPLQDRAAEAQTRRDNRDSQSVAETKVPARPAPDAGEEFMELMTKLRAAVEENPEDLRGQELLARNEANLGNLPAAYAAQAKVIELKGAAVTAGDYVLHANLLISAAGDYVSPEAEASLKQALELDPFNNLARYYMGLMMWQTGRPDATFRIWDQVLRQSPNDAPWVPSIRATITELAWYAGIDYKMPAPVPAHSPDGLSGPTAEDMEAAGELDIEDRQAMIQGMVDQLSDRLATEGGTPQEWARLIGAYGVLGNTERAQAIWTEAQQVFAQAPEALEIVRAGAAQAGVLQ
ncbi:c-type cytochrome biogenesis protein CcmI [uncultured Shimia sp.]|uniref:c-type cytochrome biogenesis protein CcmI n=1 Tax=uncultured Shimia sp. TaxID=573152 RepID=UPI00262CFC95|nr:c-type cytochrome biogenesis protein CcmI [uncultured Shimia sp.]